MRRFDHIDGLRGVAALLVVSLHTWGVADPGGATYRWLLFFDIGRIGVVAFFCISGFLIPFTITGVRSFIIRRASRILPAYWLSIPVTMLAIWIAEGRLFSFQSIALNIIMLPRFLGNSSISGVYWTLEIEALFYALCAGFFVLGGIRNASWLLAVCFIGTATFFVLPVLVKLKWSMDPDHLGFIRLTFLYMGLMALAAAFRLWREGATSRLQAAAVTAFASLFVLVFPARAILAGSSPADMQLYLATSLGILLFLSSFAFKRAFSVVQPLGRISYSFYLFHPIIFVIAPSVLPPLNPWIFGILTMSMSLILSSGVYLLIEKPGIAFGHAASRNVLCSRNSDQQ